jgi:hypothetical protein
MNIFAAFVVSALAIPAGDVFTTGDSYGPRQPSPYTEGSSLTEQQQRNEQAERATYDRLVEAGGCNADFIPVEYAAYCWRGVNGSNSPNPTGGPVGASQGGE